MGWVYLDDKFPEHPKVLAAGDDAAWLYVCGLAYTNRGSGDGTIPKAAVGRLSGLRRPLQLASRLVEVRLWHDKGDHFQVNDYEEWNAKAIARRAQARKAARTRWGDAHASDGHMLAESSRIAGAMPSPNPHPQAPSPSSSRASETHDPAGTSEELETHHPNGTSPPWKTDPFVERWCQDVTGNHSRAHRIRVLAIVEHFRGYLDDSVIDEAIGRLSKLDGRPMSPSYLLTTLQNDARGMGIDVPPLKGER